MWMITSVTQKIFGVLFPETCYLCQKPSTTLCEDCLNSFYPPLDTPYFWVSSLYAFKDDRVKKVIHAIKFFHRKDLIVPISKKLVTLLPEDNKTWTLVPIPSHYLRKMTRGYNQAELVAQEVHKRTGIPLSTSVLKKTKYTKRQAITHNRRERLTGQANTFAISSQVKGRNIILVDDVITTGATLHEARNLLLKHGASEVLAITIAH